jgi:tetratricopeptide (TPR) repeat protein
MEEKSLQAFQEVGDRRGESTTLNSLGSLLITRGELKAAKQTLDRGMVVVKESGYEQMRGYLLYNLAEVLRQQDRLQEARTNAEDALTLRKGHDEVLSADSQVQIAEISEDTGNVAQAEPLARMAIAAYGKEKVADGECIAQAVLARALVAESRPKEARSAVEEALKLSKQASDRTASYEAVLASAAVDGESNRTTNAARTLEKMLADASGHGYVAYQLEARLRLGELEIRAGKLETGRARLEALQKEANQRGFELIARKATEAMNGAGSAVH